MLELTPRDAVLVVDVQNDFCAGGALAVPDADVIVEPINELTRAAERAGALVSYSRDWHPQDHVSFHEQGGPWPRHCVRDTWGARFHPALRIVPGSLIVDKATDPAREAYSDFDGTELARTLHARGIRRVLVVGLADEYCVRSTVLDALAHGFETIVLTSCTRAIDVHPGDGERARQEMVAAGARREVWIRTAAPPA